MDYVVQTVLFQAVHRVDPAYYTCARSGKVMEVIITTRLGSPLAN